jgi:hypothetical protein
VDHAPSCALAVDTDLSVHATFVVNDPRWDPSMGARDCTNAWGRAGEKLSTCDTTKDEYVVVRKSKRNAALCSRGTLVKNFRIALGSSPVGDKGALGDGKTPEGVFFIPRVLTNHGFLLSYPTIRHASYGFAAKLISETERKAIERAQTACQEPPEETKLGGLIELIPGVSASDWTAGSVALDDAAVETLSGTLGVGDSIVILP